MKCEEVDGLMFDYLDRKLNDDQVREIENHLSTCEKCLADLMETQKVLTALKDEPLETPADSLRINFYHMLHGEINRREYQNRIIPVPVAWYNSWSFRIAAGLAIFVLGTFLGIFTGKPGSGKVTAQQIHQLQSDVTDLRKAAMFSMLKEESSSYRIQGISYVDEMSRPDQNVISALFRTLNTDKSSNVRLAALYAIDKFSDQKSICDSLVESLALQTDPLLQITLINMLVEKREKSALRLMQQIIDNKGTISEVKTVAEKGVKLLTI
jgi:hypothetical protein